MLDINFIRQNPEKIREQVKAHNLKIDVDLLLKVDRDKNLLLQKIEKLRSQKNKASKEIAKTKKSEKRKELIAMTRKISEEIKDLERGYEKMRGRFNSLMYELPNLALPDVRIGCDERDNEVIKTVGKPKKFDFKVRDHLELGERLDLIDVKRAAKVSGSRFNYLKNEAVFLEFALINFVFDALVLGKNKVINLKKIAKKIGIDGKYFKAVLPPVLVSEKAMLGMGYLGGGGEEETYHFVKDKMYFVGTAEQSIGPMHINETFAEKNLPIRYLAFSPCFRREAGSYGRDTKGILRVHQFDKIEMFSYTKPQDSCREHEFFLALGEALAQALKLPYQVVKMCSGDLGYVAAKRYDIETWIPSQEKYRETHSTSNCTDYQARRLNIKFKRTNELLDYTQGRQKNKKTNLELVHTLNGTAYALGRILIAILENYQQKDGSVKVPEVLQKYCGLKVIKK